MANIARVRTLMGELDKLAKEYISTRDDYESARQLFEAAKEKLVAVRKVAPEVLGMDWHEWTRKHPEIKLVGLDIGAAILAVLESRAYESATESVRASTKGEDKPYTPMLASFEIVEHLDAHGFAWRTGTPRREIHAALLNLKGIAKVETAYGIEYQVEGQAEVYESMKRIYGLTEEENSTDDEPVLFEDQPEPEPEPENEEEVPF